MVDCGHCGHELSSSAWFLPLMLQMSHPSTLLCQFGGETRFINIIFFKFQTFFRFTISIQDKFLQFEKFQMSK